MKMRQIMMLAAVCGAVLTCTVSRPLPAQSMSAGMGKAMPSEVYGKLLDSAEKEIVDAADAMPADKYDFAPTQGEFKTVKTYGEQVRHVAEANFSFFSSWNIPGGMQRADVEKLHGKDEIMKALRASYAYEHAALATITLDNAFVKMDAKGNTRAGIAAYSMIHSMDHYGQMVEYLRMNGIIPPASRK